jgi:hypothetical protein
MEIEYEVIFIPDVADSRTVEQTRCVSVYTNSRFSSREEIQKKARSEALQQEAIDSYALRKYWIPACCEMTVKDIPWDNISEMADWIRKKDGLETITKIENSWRNSTVRCKFDSKKARGKVQNNIYSICGKSFPAHGTENHLESTLRTKANLQTDDLGKVKQIYDIHNS